MPVPSAPAGTLAAPSDAGSRRGLRSRLSHRVPPALRHRLWDWGGPAFVVLLAAVLRLWNLGTPHELMTDETFYVKDAYTLLNLGYESAWPDDADARFEAGSTDIFTTDASFVVHPPLGKWLIALGLAAFGAESSVGWRIASAVTGILAVLVLTLVARRLFASTTLGVLAGGLMAVDGHAIVMSRVAFLDNFLMLFALLGFACVLLDRRNAAARLDAALARHSTERASPGAFGPVLWWRPWLLAAGIAFGCATAVKWSGLYFLAAFAVYSVVVDMLARRRAGVPLWLSGTVLKQAPITFLHTVPVALAVYLVSYTGWFRTSGGWNRDFAMIGDNAATGAFAWVPLPLQSLWQLHVSQYAYHVSVEADHPYKANPLTWLLLVRPFQMFYRASENGENGCEFARCSEAVSSVANPLLWWAASAAMLYLVYRLARYREWQVGLLLTGMAAGYLPWLLYLNRTVFQFYSIAFEPYLLLGITFVLGLVLGSRSDPPDRRDVGIAAVVGFLVLVLLVSAFFYPIWTGMQVPTWFWNAHNWLRSWV
ncbi:dolichyl-phosphate-mannose--protein mannosyltransferase [Planctomonas psychrotolerans]|uniref:dolichyl-phosphate-mannose--protein mannosyltransferase n=1 Tax=Planctomonas psychrotolerans TaxID=2528712 RepID=UPI00123B53F1|nr:phospholipid carrier-dependent glycosyltransferase [Planctomonas psychrotolerans]